MGELEATPVVVIRRFGRPAQGDGFKISAEYVFIDRNDQPFVVHDWKSTNLWEVGLPTPDEFWASDQPEELSIGTRDLDTSEFKRWFLEQIGEGRAEQGAAADRGNGN